MGAVTDMADILGLRKFLSTLRLSRSRSLAHT
jgi:hypothetical protein